MEAPGTKCLPLVLAPQGGLRQDNIRRKWPGDGCSERLGSEMENVIQPRKVGALINSGHKVRRGAGRYMDEGITVIIN